jgi:hypothetical protein
VNVIKQKKRLEERNLTVFNGIRYLVREQWSIESANLNAVKKKSFFSKTKIVAEYLLYKKRSVLKGGI